MILCKENGLTILNLDRVNRIFHNEDGETVFELPDLNLYVHYKVDLNKFFEEIES